METGELRLLSASREKKIKRSFAQNGRCLHGKSLPSCEGLFALVKSWQGPHLEIKFQLETMLLLLFFYGTLLSTCFSLHSASRLNMTVTKWKCRTCTSHWLTLSPLIKSNSTNELKEHGISSEESEIMQSLWGEVEYRDSRLCVWHFPPEAMKYHAARHIL